MTDAERRRIAAAIAQAEDGTTGRIAVREIFDADVDALERAKREFHNIGLHRSGQANGALILVAPKARRFAVVGDRALHARVGDAFWGSVVSESSRHFAGGAIADGVIAAVQRIGEALKAHFAQPASDRAQ
ncbi:MAG: TPM domain-containing protein [Candidatus Eremiobacteraeota bacterium]|nr:TPM domain-containing protein [Candidatus Eremiobacteraeota bacterium]